MKRKILAMLLSFTMIMALLPTSAMAETIKEYGGDELPTEPTIEGNMITVNPGNAQYTLDGAYGSIDDKTIVFSEGNYDKLELGRATKYAASNTDYYIGGVAEENKKTLDQFVAIKNSGTWSASAYYVRNMNNVTLKAAEGATVRIAGITGTSGHVYGESYDYVLDKAYTSGSAYYLTQNWHNIAIEGLTFTAPSNITSSLKTTVIDGVSFKNCKFNIGNTAEGNQALRYYNENNNGNVKNLTVDKCTFTNCYQGVYTQKINGVKVVNSTFDTTRHNAIAIQSGSEAVNHKAVVITGNTFKNIGDRIIRFGVVGADTQITIQNNTATNSGDSNEEIMKAQSLATGITYNICANNWGEGRTVANNELKEGTAVAEVKGLKYTSLEAAIGAAQTGDTVTLLSDMTVSAPITVDKNITLNLGGYGVTQSAVLTVNEGKTLTVTNNQDKTGKLTLNAPITVNGTLDASKVGYGEGKGLQSGAIQQITLGATGTLIVPDEWATEWGGIWEPDIDSAKLLFTNAAVGSTIKCGEKVWKCTAADYPSSNAFTAAVAAIDSNYYTTLTEALNAAQSGDTITILKDINGDVGLYLRDREDITLTAVSGVKVDGNLTIGYHSNQDKDNPKKENSTLTVKNITVNGSLRVDSADQKVVVSDNTAKDIKVYTWKINNMDIQILNNTVVGGGDKYGIYVVPETTNYDLKVDRNTISKVTSHALAIQGNGQGSAKTAANSISVTNNNFTCAAEKAAFKIWADTKFAPSSILSYDGLTPDMKALARKIVAEGNNTFSTADGRVMFNVYDFSFNGWTITLPSGAGYTVTPTNDSVSPVLANESYSFTLTVNSGYQKGTNFAVKANGVDLQETDGKYILSNLTADTVVTVSGITSIPSTPSGSGSSGGGGGSSTTNPSQPTTSTETKPDGSTTTTESKPDGTVTESNTSKPTTDADGNTSQTTTETTTGKDGVTESKTETVTKPDGSASSTTESTTTKPDGTKTESTTETTINKDGSTASTTTSTTTGKDGTVTESKTEATTSTVTNKDGSTTETKQETTTTSTGSKTESTTVTTVNKDGSTTATTTATTTDKAGTVTESKTESTTSKNGTTTEVTVTTETKANGTVIESKTATTTQTNGSSSSTTTATTTKADGTTTTSKTTATTSLSTNKSTGTVTETKKETTTTSDGVKSEGTTVTQIQKDGTVTSKETVKASDSTGTTATKTTTLDAKGNVTTAAEAAVSAKAVTEAAKTGAAVTIPVEVAATKSASTAPTVSVSVPKTAESVKVELPVQNVTPGTVAVIVNADGTEKIVSTSVVTDNGVALTLDGSATVKLVDNSKSFKDVPNTNVFYNEISSLSAREIMIGKTGDKFDLHNSVTLNQTANVAGRITGAVDVSDFNAGVAWGQANGLKIGNVAATRGDVLKALYIAAGSPAVEDTTILSRFKDSASIPADMTAIAAWAAQNGILKGNTDGTAGLSKYVSRGQACALAGRTMGTLA